MLGIVAIVQFIPVLIGLAIAGALSGCASTAKSPKSPSKEDPQDSPEVEPVQTTSSYDEPEIAPLSQTVEVPGDELSGEERELYEIMMQYRAEKGLPRIPLSKSMTIVANRHARDLYENVKDVTHAWSDAPYVKGKPETYPSMWTAPQRFGTGYPGNGYEIAHGGSDGYTATPNGALEGWKGSPPHNAVMVNQGIWKDANWQAVGVAIYMNYAVAWFGKEPDPTGEPVSEGAVVTAETGGATASSSSSGCGSIADAAIRKACEDAREQCGYNRSKGSPKSCDEGVSFCTTSPSWPVVLTTDKGEFDADDQLKCFQLMNTFFSIGFQLKDISPK